MPGSDSPSSSLWSSIAVALWVLAILAALWFLRLASQLFIPIVLGVLISYALEPVVGWLVRRGVPRLAAASLVLLVVLGLAGWGLYSLRDEVSRAIDALPEAARRAREMLMSQSASGPAARVQQAAGELRGEDAGGQPDAAESGQTAASKDASQGASSPGGGNSPGGGGGGMAGGLAGVIQQGVGWLFALAGHLLVIVFLVFFLLISGPHFRNRLVEIAGPALERRHVTAAVVDDINRQIERFLLVRLVTAAIVGALTWGVLAWMGVENAAVWGILAGVFNSIPYFGPIIVSGGLLVVGLVQGGGMTQALQMAGAALAITSLEGWLLTPPLMGKAERMSALAVFLGLLLWTWVWGAWGTILAVPMLVVVKSVADHVPPLQRIGRLMAP
jgi:predicted PurR-regulated permease PerM